MMKRKACPVAVKVDEGTDDGVFEAIVSVFGNVDHVNDVVQPGAFTKTLADWAARGDTMPVLWSHRSDDPRFIIGGVLDAKEFAPGDALIPDWASDAVKVGGGLYVKARITTGPDASDVATATRGLLKNRLVTQFSYAYDVVDESSITVDGQKANSLNELNVYEVSPTLYGCNSDTELIDAKALAIAVKVGRTLSSKNEDNIRKAVALLTETLAALDAAPIEDAPDPAAADAGKSLRPNASAAMRDMIALAATL